MTEYERTGPWLGPIDYGRSRAAGNPLTRRGWMWVSAIVACAAVFGLWLVNR